MCVCVEMQLMINELNKRLKFNHSNRLQKKNEFMKTNSILNLHICNQKKKNYEKNSITICMSVFVRL